MTAFLLNGPPRFAHQKAALKSLIQTGGRDALLMDPGTGKTASTLDYLSLCTLKLGKPELRVLVVCPLAAVDTWVGQAQEYLSPQISFWAEALGGNLLERAEALAARGGNPFPRRIARKGVGPKVVLDAGVHPRAQHYQKSWAWAARKGPDGVFDKQQFGPDGLGAEWPRLVLEVINIDTLTRRDQIGSKSLADVMVDAIKRFNPQVLVVDESHKIKSPTGNASKLLARVAGFVPRRILLTGTVMPAGPLDVFAQWRTLDPYAFGELQPDGSRKKATFGGFKSKYAVLGGWMGKEVTGYCNTPDAPIWMRDGTFKPLGEVEVGDSLMGWQTGPPVKGGSRRVLAESTVTGVHRRWAENVVEVLLSSGLTIRCTADHQWLRHNPKDAEDVWTTVMERPYHRNRGFSIRIKRVVEVPATLTPEERESAAWLAGFYDGEGSGAAFSQSRDHNPAVCARLERELNALGIPYREYTTTSQLGKAETFQMLGGLQTYVNVLNWLPLTRRKFLLDLIHWSRSAWTKKGAREPKRLHAMGDGEFVVSVTPLPPQEVVSMQTTTGNYVAWGLASKNCNLDDMQEIMAKNSIVVRKKDALDLPPTMDVTVPVELSAAEKRAYSEMKGSLATILNNGQMASVPSKLTLMLRLRQITAGHLPDDRGTLHVIGDSKARTIASLVQDTLTGEKRIVVFAFFTEEIHQLAKALVERGTELMVITGETPTPERIRMRKRFGSSDPTRMVMIAQIRTMSLAVNELVSANYAIFASLSQQRDDLVQARDRLDRIGQTRPVTFYYCVAPGTVDEVILRTHRERGDLESAMLRHIKGEE